MLKIGVIEYALSMRLYSHFNLIVKSRCIFTKLIVRINSMKRQKKLLLNVVIFYVITTSLYNI